MAERNYRFENITVACRTGKIQIPVTDARAVPIYQTSSYVFKNCDHAEGKIWLSRRRKYLWTSYKPTEDVFEKRIAALEGGVAALAVASRSSSYRLHN